MHGRKTNLARAALQFANQLARPLDGLAVSRTIGSTAPIMIVGLPRSGTTLVYELLVQAFEVGFLTRIYSYAYGLPNIVTRAVAGRTRDPNARYSSTYGRIPGRFAPAENAVFWDRWFPEHPELGHHVPGESISPDAIDEAAAMLSSISAIAGRPFVFKNIYMTLSLPAFFRLLPNSKVIVVTRDTKAVIASVYKKRESIRSWWTIRPPFSRDVLDRSVLEQTVFQCIRSQQLMEHSLDALPAERYKIVDYDAICEQPRKFIEDVASWAGSSIDRREDQEIPVKFNRSAGPGLSHESLAMLAEYAASLDTSRSQYLSRIQAYVAEQSAND